MNKENDMTQSVQDRPAELGIKINNVLSGLLLAAVIGVWTSISGLQDKVAELGQVLAVVQAKQTLKFEAIEGEMQGRFKAYDLQYSELRRMVQSHVTKHPNHDN